MTKYDLTPMTKRQWAPKWLQSTGPIKKELWTVMKKKMQQDSWRCGPLLTGCLKMGHICERALCLTCKKMQGCWPQYTQELCLPLCWWDSSGSREHWWPCLIRFSLCCLQPDRGWISCANKVDTHRCWWSHRTWLSYTPWMAHWGLELQWLPRQT